EGDSRSLPTTDRVEAIFANTPLQEQTTDRLKHQQLTHQQQHPRQCLDDMLPSLETTSSTINPMDPSLKVNSAQEDTYHPSTDNHQQKPQATSQDHNQVPHNKQMSQTTPHNLP
ncbi:hypothetical protein FRC11_009241, partial [Ceratobasidium sp. 423]